MAFMEWHERYRLNILAIDLQHRVLVDLTNELHRAAIESRDPEEIGYAMDELLRYIAFHFNYEETVLDEAGYPGLEAHREHHLELVKEFEALQTEVVRENLVLNDKVMNFLQGWLTHHIVSDDRDYAPYVKEAKSRRIVQGDSEVAPAT